MHRDDHSQPAITELIIRRKRNSSMAFLKKLAPKKEIEEIITITENKIAIYNTMLKNNQYR
jgi:nitrogen fixation protein